MKVLEVVAASEKIIMVYHRWLIHNYVELSIMTVKLNDIIAQVTVLYMHSSKAWMNLHCLTFQLKS